MFYKDTLIIISKWSYPLNSIKYSLSWYILPEVMLSQALNSNDVRMYGISFALPYTHSNSMFMMKLEYELERCEQLYRENTEGKLAGVFQRHVDTYPTMCWLHTDSKVCETVPIRSYV